MQKIRRESHMACVIKRVEVGASLLDQGLELHYLVEFEKERKGNGVLGGERERVLAPSLLIRYVSYSFIEATKNNDQGN